MATIVKLLHLKGVSLGMLQDTGAKLSYDHNNKRLCIETPTGLIGRSLDPSSKVKWYVYHSKASYAPVRTYRSLGNVLVLTEDFLSAVKASRHLPGHSVIACLGTRICKDLMSRIIKDKPKVLIMFDKDKAGELGASKALRSLHLQGVSAIATLPPKGDPKNQPAEWFNEVLKMEETID